MAASYRLHQCQRGPLAVATLCLLCHAGTAINLLRGGHSIQSEGITDDYLKPWEELLTRWTGVHAGGPDAPLLEELQVDPPAVRLPVLLVPPLLGVEIDARINKPVHSPHFWCQRSSNGAFEQLWISPRVVLPGQFSCIAENLRLQLDRATNRSRPVAGVTARATSGFNDPHQSSTLNVFQGLRQRLQQLGWREGVDLATHVYDWRLSPLDWAAAEQAQGWADLRCDIERLSARNDGRPVVLIALSLGAPYASTFLSHVDDDHWKAKHVAALFSISGVFGGTPVAVWNVVSGRLQGWEALFPREDVTRLLQSIPSLAWLAPWPQVYGDVPIVTNTALGLVYKVSQVGQVLKDAGAGESAAFWQVAAPWSPAKAPGVKVYCMYSHGLPTASKLTYHTPDFSDYPDVQNTDGDITVPLRALSACEAWSKVPGHPPVTSKVWWGVMHAGILMRADGMQYILEQLVTLSSGHSQPAVDVESHSGAA